ncbi:hypothetical protein BDV06DRAFT_226775 [Aspergillus oleicola]
MYSYTPTSKFLVLAPIQSAPLSVANEQTEINNTQVRERSDSKSSTSSSQLNRGVARLPTGEVLHHGVSVRAGHDISEKSGGNVLFLMSLFLFLVALVTFPHTTIVL